MTNQPADGDELRAQIHAEYLKAPDPVKAKKATESLRAERARFNREEIANYHDRIAALAQNNAELIGLGEAAIHFVAADPLDMDFRAIRTQIAVLDRLLGEQCDTLAALHGRRAAEEYARIIARETPTERDNRLLREEVASLRSLLADLRADVVVLQQDRLFAPAAKPKPAMAGLAMLMGDGLLPRV